MERTAVPLIIVLGAPNDDGGKLLPVAEGRALTALREYQRAPEHRIVITGGFGEHFNRASRPHHDYVADFLVGRGVPESALLGRVASGNTIEDAEQTAALLSRTLGAEPVALKVVTSDFHVARARLLFERAFPTMRATIEMIAAPAVLPVDDLVKALRHEADAIDRLTRKPT